MTDRQDAKPHRPAPTAGDNVNSSTAPGSSSNSKRPRWATSTFGPTGTSSSSSVDKGKGREQADDGQDRRLSRVAPPSFAFPGKSAKPLPKPMALAVSRAAGRLPQIPLKLPDVAGESPDSRSTKRPRTSTGSILGRLPIPLAAAPPSPNERTTTPTLNKTRPLSLATSFSGGGSGGGSGSKPASLRRTMALSSVVPPAALQTPTKVKAVKTERELVHGLLAIPQGKERMKEEAEASTSAAAAGSSTARDGGSAGGVKLEDALLGVSPRKARKARGPKGNLHTAASLLLTSHSASATRFYQSLLARREAPPPADIELRIIALPTKGSAAMTAMSPGLARRLFPFQKASPAVKRIALVCSPAGQAVKREPAAAAADLVPASSGLSPSPSPRRNSFGSSASDDGEHTLNVRVHVLLRLDEHSTSLPPTVSRWAKLHVGQRVLGWRPWVELGTVTTGADGTSTAARAEERVLGLERFVVLDE